VYLAGYVRFSITLLKADAETLALWDAPFTPLPSTGVIKEICDVTEQK
jgi:hypothetical protein